MARSHGLAMPIRNGSMVSVLALLGACYRSVAPADDAAPDVAAFDVAADVVAPPDIIADSGHDSAPDVAFDVTPDIVVPDDVFADAPPDVPPDVAVPLDVADAGPPTVRLVAPGSTASVTSQSPTLRWELSATAIGAHVEICSDRPCARVEMSLDASGRSTAVPTALSPGVHFWHARASTGSLYTFTWEFWVGARTTAVDTSSGTTLDVNGDGFADVVVGADDAMAGRGRVYVYLGSSAGLGTTPATTLSAMDGFFGRSVASAGDVNGDGFGDLIVGANEANGSSGGAYVYLGGATGLATSPSVSMIGPDGPGGEFGNSVASVGDMNGDGYADIVVGAYDALPGGRAYIYFGGDSGPAALPSTTLSAPEGSGSAFGYSVASAGDVDGDGLGDLVAGADEWGGDATGRVYLYFGSRSGFAMTPSATLMAPVPLGNFGYSVASAGDVNGDGYSDVIVAAPGASSSTGGAYVYLGGAFGLGSNPAATFTGSIGVSSVASAGDIDGDGFDDVVVGAADESTHIPHADVYLGRRSGVAMRPASELSADGRSSGFGGAVSGAGDVNGDGFADLLIGAPGTNLGTGAAHLYLGSATGLGTLPTTTLNGMDGFAGYFGGSVASADGTTSRTRPGSRSRCAVRHTRDDGD